MSSPVWAGPRGLRFEVVLLDGAQALRVTRSAPECGGRLAVYLGSSVEEGLAAAGCGAEELEEHRAQG